MSESVAQALVQARSQGLDRLDAHLLLAHVLARPRTWLLAHGDDQLPAATAVRYAEFCRRRAQGEPLAYLTGEREFHGLRFEVGPGVLVPRPDTETLVDWALELLLQGGDLGGVEAPRVVDLGTGSGAIAVSVKQLCPRARMTALDISAEALAQAANNAGLHGQAIEFRQGDWWHAAVPSQRFHLALTNPPYIPAGDPHLAALRHEPQVALSPGSDGLGAIHTIVKQAGKHLHPGAWLLTEHGRDQAQAVRNCLAEAGFASIATRADIEGRDRCTGGRWPAG